MTRRTLARRALMSSLAVAAMKGQEREPREWKPLLGVLGHYTKANVEFARAAGFDNMILSGGPGSTLDANKVTGAEVDEIKQVLAANKMHVSAFQIDGSHIDPNPEKRERTNAYFVKAIELAGKLGVPYIGTCSGKDASKSFEDQVAEIVKVYRARYFDACEKNHVKLLWEPYPGNPNIATSPVAYRALFKAFGDAPYVGLQYDPSHLVRQFMDPIATAREFADKIYDVHLKDTEILWPVLRDGGIQPVNHARWWRYRIPGMGQIVWRDFFSVLQDQGYRGAMSIEQEDPLYGGESNQGPDFSEDFKTGFVMAKRYLAQYVP